MATRSLVVNFIGDTAQLEAALKRTTAQLSGLQKAGNSMNAVGSSLTRGLTLPIVGVGVATAKLALDFQSSTEKIRTQAGATQAQVDKLRQGMLNMAGSLGTTPEQLSVGMYHVVSSMNAVLPPTHRVSSELLILKDAAKLAQVGGSDLEETSYALASAMNALHAPVSQAGKVTAQLNAIVGAGDMTMTDLIEGFKSGIVPAAKEAGLSLQSLGAALAVMGDMGMRGSLAGTRLRMAIALLSSPSSAAAKVLDTLGLSAKQATSTSAAMSAALQKAGLQTTQLGADLKKPDGFMVALQDLNQHLRDSGLTATGAAAVMNKAFGGGRMGATITLLAENTGRLQTKFDQIGHSAGQFGADWKATTHTMAFQWHAMVAALEADGIKIGTEILPVVMPVLQQIGHVVSGLAQNFASLPAPVKRFGVEALIAVAALGPMLKLGGGLIRTFGGLTSVLGGTAKGLRTVYGLIAGTSTLGMSGGGVGGGGGRGGASRLPKTLATGNMGFGLAKAGLSSVLSRGAGALAAGTIGVAVSQAVGSAVHGAVGSAVHGAVGSAIKTIGTDTSIGAGIGAIFGPEGMAGGAIIGGLVGTLSHFISADAGAQGRDFANRFLAPMPAAVRTTFAKPLADVTNKLNSDLHPSPVSVTPGSKGRFGSPIFAPGPSNAQIQREFFNQGWLAGESTVKGLNSVKDPTAPLLMQDFMGRLQRLPAQARPEAAKVMLSYAESLHQNGKLPSKQLADIIVSMEQSFPGLQRYMTAQGLSTDKGLASALRFTTATATLKQTLAGYRVQFGDWAISTKLTESNINQNTATAMAHLHQIISVSTGQTRKDAVKELRQLESQVGEIFSGMTGKVSAAAGDMRQAVARGSQQAYSIGAKNWGAFAKAVGRSVASGVLSTQQGANLIAKALNSTLKAFGEKGLSVTQIKGLTPGQIQGLASGQLTAGGVASPHAVGGYIGRPGERGPDSVPIVVGRGEAILNHSQQGVVNAALAAQGIGGLPEVFKRMRTPHYFAAGGFAGGPMGAMVRKADQINAKHYPYVWGGGHNSTFTGPYDCSGAVSAVLHAGGLLRAPEVAQQFMSYGLRGPGPVTLYASPSHVYMSLDGRFFGTHGADGAGWYAGGPMAGFVERHPPVGLGRIAAPQVTGTGTIPAIVRAALGIAAKSANARLSAALAAMTAGGGFGGGDAGTFASSMAGPVEGAVYRFFSGKGFNKVAIAGMLGNAAQESAMNPNTAGGGLWQQISNFGQGTGGSLLNQMQVMLPQIVGFRRALNAAGTPASAAALFMNTFERPNPALANLAHRESAARAAYAAGYSGGGFAKIPTFAGWHADGVDTVVSRPTLFGAGESGIERVQITPGRSAGQGRGGDVHVHGDLIVREEADADRIASKLAWRLQTA